MGSRKEGYGAVLSPCRGFAQESELKYSLQIAPSFEVKSHSLPCLPCRVVELETWIKRHKEHVARLEQVLRLLENDQVRLQVLPFTCTAMSECMLWGE